jgi:hypothetical protein
LAGLLRKLWGYLGNPGFLGTLVLLVGSLHPCAFTVAPLDHDTPAIHVELGPQLRVECLIWWLHLALAVHIPNADKKRLLGCRLDEESGELFGSAELRDDLLGVLDLLVFTEPWLVTHRRVVELAAVMARGLVANKSNVRRIEPTAMKQLVKRQHVRLPTENLGYHQSFRAEADVQTETS